MALVYRKDIIPPAETVADLFDDSGLKRPTGAPERIFRMLAHADIVWTVWEGEVLVGIARTITDYSYCAYLSDLAVRRSYQRQGVGRELIRRTQELLGDEVMLLLLAAETATDYYAHIGFTKVENGWMLPRKK
jgi:GNAT superfamily N-acetyltransferase